MLCVSSHVGCLAAAGVVVGFSEVQVRSWTVPASEHTAPGASLGTGTGSGLKGDVPISSPMGML